MKRRLFLLANLLFAFLVSPIFVPIAQAQTGDIASFGITISPVIDEFSSKFGSVTQRTIKITNPIQDVISLYPQALNFYTDNDKGQPKFYSLAERNSRYSISDWITFSKPLIRIAPGEVEEFTYTLTVPEDAEPGGHYGAVLFSTKPPATTAEKTEGNQVSVVGLIGTLVLHTTPGKVTQEATLKEFTAPNVIVKPPANFSLTFENTGNVHIKPTGDIKIRNMFGAVVETMQFNGGGGSVLPESSRKYEASWKFSWNQVGKFTATAVAIFGTPEQQVTSVRTFYVIPVWLLIAIGVILLYVTFLIVRAKWRKRSRPEPPVASPPIAPPNASPPKPEPPKFVMR